ncbi:Putative manganese exporter [Synechococcus sp. CBW1107]|nr:Putative manganese exporter [Synechococcus sp. CBW1107]
MGEDGAMSTPFFSDPGLAAFGSGLTAITLAEVGDKTFFVALLLAARHSGRTVFLGAFAALSAVTLLSLGVGYGLRELLPAALMPWLAALLFLGFGAKLLLDAQRLPADDGSDEEEEAAALVQQAEGRGEADKPGGVIWEAFSLVFLAELGDRTQIATILLAAAPAFTLVGLVAGTLLGHALVTALAILAGKWIGQRIQERLLYRLSGGLFLAFGLVSLRQAIGVMADS